MGQPPQPRPRCPPRAGRGSKVGQDHLALPSITCTGNTTPQRHYHSKVAKTSRERLLSLGFVTPPCELVFFPFSTFSTRLFVELAAACSHPTLQLLTSAAPRNTTEPEQLGTHHPLPSLPTFPNSVQGLSLPSSQVPGRSPLSGHR